MLLLLLLLLLMSCRRQDWKRGWPGKEAACWGKARAVFEETQYVQQVTVAYARPHAPRGLATPLPIASDV